MYIFTNAFIFLFVLRVSTSNAVLNYRCGKAVCRRFNTSLSFRPVLLGFLPSYYVFHERKVGVVEKVSSRTFAACKRTLLLSNHCQPPSRVD